MAANFGKVYSSKSSASSSSSTLIGSISRSTSSSLLGFVSKSCAEHEEEAHYLFLYSDILILCLFVFLGHRSSRIWFSS